MSVDSARHEEKMKSAVHVMILLCALENRVQNSPRVRSKLISLSGPIRQSQFCNAGPAISEDVGGETPGMDEQYFWHREHR